MSSFNLKYVIILCIISAVAAAQYQFTTMPNTQTSYKPSDCNTLENRAKNTGMKNLRGRYYFFSRDEKSWNLARLACLNRGSEFDLVSIDSKEENTAIVEYISSKKLDKKTFWTGGTDAKLENTWVWIRSGAKFNFTNWANEEPNSNFNDEDCVALYRGNNNKEVGHWNDAYCGREFYYICELYWPEDCRNQMINSTSTYPNSGGLISCGTTISLITLYSFILLCATKIL